MLVGGSGKEEGHAWEVSVPGAQHAVAFDTLQETADVAAVSLLVMQGGMGWES